MMIRRVLVSIALLAAACSCRKNWVEGDRCSMTDFSHGGCRDPDTLLKCSLAGTVIAVPCRGPGRCSEREGTATCDLSVARVDEPCTDSGMGGACGDDGKTMLMCFPAELPKLPRWRLR